MIAAGGDGEVRAPATLASFALHDCDEQHCITDAGAPFEPLQEVSRDAAIDSCDEDKALDVRSRRGLSTRDEIQGDLDASEAQYYLELEVGIFVSTGVSMVGDQAFGQGATSEVWASITFKLGSLVAGLYRPDLLEVTLGRTENRADFFCTVALRWLLSRFRSAL